MSERGDPFAEAQAFAEHMRAALGEPQAGGELRCVSLCPICRAADVLRASAPPELRDQWQALQREALVTLRAVVDHYIQRLDGDPVPGPRVEDIPID